MYKIDMITDEQKSLMAVYRDKWIKIGLSTEPANRRSAQDGIRLAYKAAGLDLPKKIVWCGSPLSQGMTRAILNKKIFLRKDSVWASVRDSVWASVRDSVWDSVRASVSDSVMDSVMASVWASVGASVRDSVWASVGASVRDSVRDSVWASVRDSVRDSVWASDGDSVGDSVGDSGYGQHDASWLAVYEYFREVFGLQNETNNLSGLTIVAKNAGWFLPHERICFVSERHNILERDERGRLHSMTGPAIMYPDGWKIYAVHGVRIPADLIENKKSITPDRIHDERNAEIRRVMIDLYGQQRYLVDSGANEISRDDFGVLYRKELLDDEPLVMVRVVNSTPEPDGSFKDYFLRVPPEIRTAHEAVAWTYGKTTKQYAPKIET